MIAFIEGNILFIDGSSVVLGVQGVGYQLLLSKRDVVHLSVGQKSSFHVYTHVREDALELFGFRSQALKNIFQHLISVSGVGPKLALSILSILDADEIISALLTKDLAKLSSVPGIGKKTAERLILELRDKMSKLENNITLEIHEPEGALINVSKAIKNLGYSKSQGDWAIAKLDDQDKALPLEELIKKTINLLSGPKT